MKTLRTILLLLWILAFVSTLSAGPVSARIVGTTEVWGEMSLWFAGELTARNMTVGCSFNIELSSPLSLLDDQDIDVYLTAFLAPDVTIGDAELKWRYLNMRGTISRSGKDAIQLRATIFQESTGFPFTETEVGTIAGRLSHSRATATGYETRLSFRCNPLPVPIAE